MKKLFAVLLFAAVASGCTEHYVDGKTYYCDYVPAPYDRIGCVTVDESGKWWVVWP